MLRLILMSLVITLTLATDQIFWTELSNFQDTCQLMQGDTTGTLKTKILTHEFSPDGTIRYNPDNENIYWFQAKSDFASYDLSAVKVSQIQNPEARKVLFNSNVINAVNCLAVDRSNGKVYYGFYSKVLEGSFGASDLFEFVDLFVSEDTTQVYRYIDLYDGVLVVWTDDRRVLKIDTDSGEIEVLAEFPDFRGSHIVGDFENGYVYVALTNETILSTPPMEIWRVEFATGDKELFWKDPPIWYMRELRIHDGTLYFSHAPNAIYSLDTPLGTVQTVVELEGTAGLFGFDLDLDNNLIFVSALVDYSHTLLKYNVETETWTQMYYPEILAPAGVNTIDGKLHFLQRYPTIQLKSFNLDGLVKTVESLDVWESEPFSSSHWSTYGLELTTENAYFGYGNSVQGFNFDSEELSQKQLPGNIGVVRDLTSRGDKLYVSTFNEIKLYDLTENTISTLHRPFLKIGVSSSFRLHGDLIFWKESSNLFKATPTGATELLGATLESAIRFAISPEDEYVVSVNNTHRNYLNVENFDGEFVSSVSLPGTIVSIEYIEQLSSIHVMTEDTIEYGVIHEISSSYDSIETSYPEVGYGSISGFAYDSTNACFYVAVGRSDLYKVTSTEAVEIASNLNFVGEISIHEESQKLYYKGDYREVIIFDIATSTEVVKSNIRDNQLILARVSGDFLYIIDDSYKGLVRFPVDDILGEDSAPGEDVITDSIAAPDGMFVAGDWLYYGDIELQSLNRVNLDTKQVQTVFKTPENCFPSSLKVATNGKKVYFNNLCVENFFRTIGIYEYSDYELLNTTGEFKKLHDIDHVMVGGITVADATPVYLILDIDAPTPEGDDDDDSTNTGIESSSGTLALFSAWLLIINL